MYELTVVRERRQGYGPRRQITNAAEVYKAFRERFEARDREEFLVLLLDGKGRAMGFNAVALGSLTASLVHPREVFKAAILANAASMILVHNHPSGDPTPSPEDEAITVRLRAAGDLLGIKVLDHVVIGDESYRSLSEGGLL